MLCPEIIEPVPLISKKEEIIDHRLYNGKGYSSILFPEKKQKDVVVYTKSVGDLIKQKLEAIAAKADPDQEDAFQVCDLGEVVRQLDRWKKWLPRIEPFYAIKCNPDPMIVNLLASLGCGFDCASKEEMEQVLHTGIASDRIIYANPCKQPYFLEYAAEKNVSCMTFDNVDELYKIKAIYSTADLVLRILVDDTNAQFKLGLKFGAPLNSVQQLLETAKELELNVIGVSFHVGCGNPNVNAFVDAVERARRVFDQAKQMGFQFSLLDVGGGFYGAEYSSEQQSKDGATTKMSFEKVAAVLGPAVDRLFPREVRVIAEPGRFFVSSAYTACVNIIGRRKIMIDDKTEQDQQYMYYLNDGVNGSFNKVFYEGEAALEPKVLLKDDKFMYDTTNVELCFESSLWGPTCDCVDCLGKSFLLPELAIGDWLYFNNMGAYSNCLSNQFNGFRAPRVSFYTNNFHQSQQLR